LTLSPDVETALRAYRWPGNVRELQNLCARWAEMCTGVLARLDDLPPEMHATASREAESTAEPSDRSLRAIQDQTIIATLQECEDNISAAARKLGVSRTTLYQKLRRIRSV
jgi:transcriptional regulator of acetoin/glycerol metabolism